MTDPDDEPLTIALSAAEWREFEALMTDIADAGTAGDSNALRESITETRRPRGHAVLVLTDLPAGFNPYTVTDSLAARVRTGKLVGVSDIHDVSSEDNGPRVEVTFRPDTGADLALDRLVSQLVEIRSDEAAIAAGIREVGRTQAAVVDDGRSSAITFAHRDWVFVTEALLARADPGVRYETTPPEGVLGVIMGRVYPPVVEKELLSGGAPGGLRWTVTVSGPAERYFVSLHVYSGEEFLGGGSHGGHRPPDGEYFIYGHSSSSRYANVFVNVDADPVVDRVIATTDRGTEVVLALSAPSVEYGLRFGIGVLPEGEHPAHIRAEIDGVVVQAQANQYRDPRTMVHGPDGVLYRPESS